MFLHLLLAELAARIDRAARRVRSADTVTPLRPRLTAVPDPAPHPVPQSDEPAEPAPTAPPSGPTGPAAPRLVPVPPPLREPSTPRVRPYLVSSAQHRRRVELALALDGIDIGPDVIHGHRVGALSAGTRAKVAA